MGLADRDVLVHGRPADDQFHLGSANVLVLPGDRWLGVVVPGRNTGRGFVVPFGGGESRRGPRDHRLRR
ncbi:hypothetical protein [Kibdelosporangium persicum]|uniref:hypothetical protein n=1 Tax=Kibdelosporangium persicum TaxID=2698649 RepID=UPI0015652135|nr:hypothetical protein [Kibdelosporangium persicum]